MCKAVRFDFDVSDGKFALIDSELYMPCIDLTLHFDQTKGECGFVEYLFKRLQSGTIESLTVYGTFNNN